MGERGFETPNNLGGDLWSMGFDVVLALDTHSSRKSNLLGISSASPVESGGVNLSYGDMLLHRFDEDLNEGDIAQITDLTNSLPKGDVESAQSFLAKIACQDLTRELSETQIISPRKSIETALFAAVNEDDSHSSTSDVINKQYPQPVDVYGRVSLYEGKLILQLKHFNASTNYPISVSECWLCREKMSNGAQIHSHKHALQGLFQVNDEFVQMDIDHYIIPDQALEPDPPPDINRTLASDALIVASNAPTMEHINADRSLGLGEVIECAQVLEDNHVPLDVIENSLHAPPKSLMTSENQKVNPELHYADAELNNALTTTHPSLSSTATINSNGFLNTFTSSHMKLDHLPSSIVQTLSETVMIDHVTDTISPTSASTFPPPSLALNSNTVNNSNGLISSNCIDVATNDNLMGSNYLTQRDSTLSDVNSVQELCSSSHTEQRNDSFMEHTTYEPNIGNKEQLESYQNFFGDSYSYAYDNTELSSQLPKLSSIPERPLELPSSQLCASVVDEEPYSVSTTAKKSSEVGAKRRKSKAHKKPSRIRMRESPPLEPLLFENNNSSYPLDGRGGDKPESTLCLESKTSISSSHKSESGATETMDSSDRNAGTKDTCKTSENTNLKSTSLANEILSSRVTRKEMPFSVSCPSCLRMFSSNSISDFKDHINVHNFEPSYLFVCPVCSKKVSGSLKYIQHLKMHIGTRHFCSKCDANYRRVEKLRMHITKMHDNKRAYVCDVCSKGFHRIEYLKAHKNIHLGKTYECDVCHLFYSSPYNLHVHKKSHTGKLPHACHLCDKAFIRRDVLLQHIAKDHKNKRYKCDICSKLYSRKDVLRRHQETHDAKRTYYPCDQCNRKFRRKDSLKAHSYKHQEPRNENSKDKSRYGKKAKPKEMSVRHEKQSQEQCSKCLKYLPSSSKLEKHLQWHQSQLKEKAIIGRESNKTFKCDTCSKSFRTKESIKTHIFRFHLNTNGPSKSAKRRQQHDEEANNGKFICEVCSKGFTRRSNLKSHLKTHLKMDTDDDEILAEIPTVLNASKANALKEKHFTSMEMPDRGSSPSLILEEIPKESTPNVSNFRLLLEGNLVTPNSAYNSSFGSNLSGDLPNTSFCASPNSPINLSTEAISAAAYLLTHPFYEGTYQ